MIAYITSSPIPPICGHPESECTLWSWGVSLRLSCLLLLELEARVPGLAAPLETRPGTHCCFPWGLSWKAAPGYIRIAQEVGLSMPQLSLVQEGKKHSRRSEVAQEPRTRHKAGARTGPDSKYQFVTDGSALRVLHLGRRPSSLPYEWRMSVTLKMRRLRLRAKVIYSEALRK